MRRYARKQYYYQLKVKVKLQCISYAYLCFKRYWHLFRHQGTVDHSEMSTSHHTQEEQNPSY